jgi:hypothetical protein
MPVKDDIKNSLVPGKTLTDSTLSGTLDQKTGTITAERWTRKNNFIAEFRHLQVSVTGEQTLKTSWNRPEIQINLMRSENYF